MLGSANLTVRPGAFMGFLVGVDAAVWSEVLSSFAGNGRRKRNRGAILARPERWEVAQARSCSGLEIFAG